MSLSVCRLPWERELMVLSSNAWVMPLSGLTPPTCSTASSGNRGQKPGLGVRLGQ